VRLDGLIQLKNPLISSEIKPAGFRRIYQLLFLLLFLYCFGENIIACLQILSVLSGSNVQFAMLILLTVTN
jgi:hypothetical protein